MVPSNKCIVCLGELSSNHKCPERVLKAKDSAGKRDPNERRWSDRQRLDYGFMLMGMNGVLQ